MDVVVVKLWILKFNDRINRFNISRSIDLTQKELTYDSNNENWKIMFRGSFEECMDYAIQTNMVRTAALLRNFNLLLTKKITEEELWKKIDQIETSERAKQRPALTSKQRLALFEVAKKFHRENPDEFVEFGASGFDSGYFD